MKRIEEKVIEQIRNIESDLTVMGEAIKWIEKGVVNEQIITTLKTRWKSMCDSMDEIRYDIYGERM